MAKSNKPRATADILKIELAEKGAIDVGAGAELELGVSSGVLQEALFILETEGYSRFGVSVPQATNSSNRTITQVIANPDISQKKVLDKVHALGYRMEWERNDNG